MRVLQKQALKAFLNKWATLVACAFVLIGASLSSGETLESVTPNWEKGQAWKLHAVFRGMDGEWSKTPLEIDAGVTDCRDNHCSITFHLTIGNTAELLFQKPDYQLVQVSYTELLRNRKLEQKIAIEGAAPVYIDFGIIPIYMPIFRSDETTDSYLLRRVHNDNVLLPVQLSQKIVSFEDPETTEWLPDDIKELWNEELASGEPLWVLVSKGEKPIFKQLWKNGLPWPIYTESQKVRIWLDKP